MMVRAIVEVMISLVVSFVVAVLSSSSFVMMMRSIILVVHFWLRRLDTRVGMGVSVAVVSNLVMRLINQISSTLVVNSFAAVGMSLLAIVRVSVLMDGVAVAVVASVVNALILVVVSVVHGHTLDFVVVVLVVVRVRSAHILRVGVVVRSLRNNILLLWSRHSEVPLQMLLALIVISVVFVAVRVLRGHMVVQWVHVMLRVNGIWVALVILVCLGIVTLIEDTLSLGVLTAFMASLVRLLTLIVSGFALVASLSHVMNWGAGRLMGIQESVGIFVVAHDGLVLSDDRLVMNRLSVSIMVCRCWNSDVMNNMLDDVACGGCVMHWFDTVVNWRGMMNWLSVVDWCGMMCDRGLVMAHWCG